MRPANALNLSPEREAELLGASVGPMEELNGPIVLAPYSEDWPIRFERLKADIQQVLGHRGLEVEHVGSTSVPGLRAKPIIDIVLLVESPADEAAYVPSLEALGYHLKFREPDWHEHRMLRLAEPAAHLHVFSADCSEVPRMLAFRDWLRTHPEDRVLYEREKVQLAARHWKYMQAYADAKSDVIASIIERAQRCHPSR